MEISRVECLKPSLKYFTPGFPDGGTIRCVAGKDTGCGDVEAVGNSNQNCTENVCEYTCEDSKFLHGVTMATCTIVNGTKTLNIDANLYDGETSSKVTDCADTMCGDLDTLGMSLKSS
jgi:hypothetical protein